MLEPSLQIKDVIRYKTTDLKEFSDRGSAIYHQTQIELCKKANQVLNDGGSVGDALRAVDRMVPDPILDRVTAETQLVISHWQCRDTPGYKVQRFLPDWSLDVWGDAGSWSGPYGNKVKMNELARYVKHDGALFNLPHRRYICTSNHEHGGSCQFCDGGLFACTVCGGFEGSLTTHCPGRTVTHDEEHLIYNEGKLDFRNGEWVQEPNPCNQGRAKAA